MPKVPENFMMQRRMSGLDVYQPASDLAPGDLTDCTNLYSYDGELYSRWGKQACFVSPPSSSPNYGMTEFLGSSGTPVIVFCNGGKLYVSTTGTPPLTYEEILVGGTTSFHLNSPQVAMKVSGKYLYVVDGMFSFSDLAIDASNDAKVTSASWGFTTADVGKQITITSATGTAGTWIPGVYTITSVNGSGVAALNTNCGSTSPSAAGGQGNIAGPLYRVNPDAAFTTGFTNNMASPLAAEVVTALNVPNAPAAQLSNTIIDGMDDVTNWSSYPTLSFSGETVTNTTFANASSSDNGWPPTGWQTGGDSMDFQLDITTTSPAHNEGYFDAGKAPQWVDWDTPTPVYTSDNTVGSPRVFAASVQAHGWYQGGGTLTMQVFAEDASVLPTTLVEYTDLAFVSYNAGSQTSIVSSVARPFTSADVGKGLTFSATTGFTAGGYTIGSVSSGQAELNGVVATSTATGGMAVLGLDSSGTTWGDSNFTLYPEPPSTVPGAVLSNTFTNMSYGTSKYEYAFSFSSMTEDFDFVRLRLQSPAAEQAVGVYSPSFQIIDVRLIATQASNGINLAANNPAGIGYNCLGGVWIKRDYTGGLVSTFSTLKILTSSGTISTIEDVTGTAFTTANVGQILTITTDTGGWTAGNYPITAVSGGIATITGNPGSALLTGGAGTAVGVEDYSKSNILSIAWSAPSTTPQIPWRFGILKAGQSIGTDGSNILWSNLATYAEDGNSFYCDISSIDILDIEARAQTAYLFLQIMTDLPSTINPSNLCTLGPITAAGNFSVGLADYNYVQVEAQDTSVDTEGSPTGDTTDGVILSDPSGPSTPNLMPTDYQAQASLTLAEIVNTVLTNWLYVYRFGGALSGPNVTVYTSYALLAECPRWSGSTNGQSLVSTDGSNAGSWTWDTATSTWNSTDGYRTWNPSTFVLTDNTPDLALICVSYLESGHEAPPMGVSAIELWNNRLVLAQGSTIYIRICSILTRLPASIMRNLSIRRIRTRWTRAACIRSSQTTTTISSP